jgi:hypothetical protein
MDYKDYVVIDYRIPFVVGSVAKGSRQQKPICILAIVFFMWPIDRRPISMMPFDDCRKIKVARHA